ncbi:dTMP kinase [Spiroplasma endosymbiont of Crioceris asparagi]|uniref:dTMP kinase n=1 Tax=Spiroplasma endosymbiont of Crioceris asparagi TaxID=3066286 RepID=UPI0030D202EF
MFITFEGIDGSGKSTISKLIFDKLQKEGHKVILTREPGGDVIAEKLRKFILDTDNKDIKPWTEVLLYIAARKQHVDTKIKKALCEGNIVICDRFMDSTTAYQGFGRGLDIYKIDELQKYILEDNIPDLTIFFDINADQVLTRIKKRNETKDRLEEEGISFQKNVYQGYKKLIEKYPDRIKRVDATRSIDQVVNDTFEIINKKIKG